MRDGVFLILASVVTMQGDLGIASEAVGETATPVYAPGAVDPACQRRFLSEAERGWKSAKARLRGFEVTAVFRNNMELPSPTGARIEELTATAQYCVAANGINRLTVESHATGTVVSAANERYTFSIQRNPESPTAQLLKSKPRKADPARDLPIDIALHEGALQAPWCAWWVPLDFMMNNDDFTLVTCERLPTDPHEEVVRVAYRYDGKPRSTPPKCQPGCIYWADLIPDRGWLAKRSGANGLPHGADTARVVCDVDYQEMNDAHPFPRSVTLVYSDDGSNHVFEVRRSEFGIPEPCRRDDAEFFLPHYGVSEASLETVSPTGRWKLRTMAAAGAAIAVAALLIGRFRARRMRRLDVSS